MQDLIGNLIPSWLAEYELNKVQYWYIKATLNNLIITASIGCYSYLDGVTDMLISVK